MNKNSFQFTWNAIGTTWVIDIFDSNFIRVRSEEEIILLIEKIKNRVELFEQTYSRFRENSWLSQLKPKISEILESAAYTIPSDGKILFDLYQTLYTLTNGKMTPLMGQVLVDAGYDEKYSLIQKKELISPPELKNIAEFQDKETIIIKGIAKFDFGAIGKGYLIDIVCEILREEEISSFCVDAGGDMHYQGENEFKIGLENPIDTSKVIGIVSLKNKSIAGSAGNRRVWDISSQKINHIINPLLLTSDTNILAIWVIAETTTIADAMTTALYFTSAEILENHFEFEYLILKKDMSVEGSLLKNQALELYKLV